jgi:hypothetical protein
LLLLFDRAAADISKNASNRRGGAKNATFGAGRRAFANLFRNSKVWLYNARMSVSIIIAGTLVCFGLVLLVIYFLSGAHMMVVLALGVMCVIVGAFLCADLFTRRD